MTASDITIGAGLLSDSETGIEDGTTNLQWVGPQSGNPGSYFRFRYAAITQTRFNDDYIEFTVTPSVGQTLDLTSLSLDLVNFSGECSRCTPPCPTIRDFIPQGVTPIDSKSG